MEGVPGNTAGGTTSVKEATVGRAQEAGSTIVETVRANPVPAALTGIGLGWLYMSARRQSCPERGQGGGREPGPYQPVEVGQVR